MRENMEPSSMHANNLAYDFAGRRVLVTGASRGIAAELSKVLGSSGAHVIIHFSAAADLATGSQDAAETLRRFIQANGGSADLVEEDLSIEGGGRRLAQKALALGAIDTVILSASRQIHKDVLRQTGEDIECQFRINLYANIELVQGLIPQMANAGFGRILSIGSVQERAPSAEMPIYALCKAGLRNFIENLALQLGRHGITANNVAPGLIATDRNAFRRTDALSWAATSVRSSAVGRAGLPADLVAPVLMLLAREAGYVSGATLHVTGGAHITRNSTDGAFPKLDISKSQTETGSAVEPQFHSS